MSPSGRFRIALAALAALHAGALGVRTARQRALDDDPLALTVQRLASGRSETLGRIARGHPLLLVFWTSWCAYCAEELEQGPALVERLDGRVEVVFVNVGEHRATVLHHPETLALADRMTLDSSGRVARALGVRGYPTRVLLGPRGERLSIAAGREDPTDHAREPRITDQGSAGE